MRGIYIVRSKSNRACCEVCSKPIKEPIRIYSSYSMKYLHLYCAGFTIRKLKTLKGWKEINSMYFDDDFLQELIYNEP